MESLGLIGGIIGFLVNVPLVLGILNNKVKQNFVTYYLWGILDVIVFVTIILQGGKNFWLPGLYALGAFVVASLLVFKVENEQIELKTWYGIKKFAKKFWLEFLVVILIIITLTFWYLLGNKAGNIVSVIALMIASVPQIVSTYKDPRTTPTIIYSFYSFAGFLSFLGGVSWNIEDKLYPASAFLFCLLITFLSMRKTPQIVMENVIMEE